MTSHRLGFAVVFDGIDPILATHSTITIAGHSVTHAVLRGPPGGSGESLDRFRSLVTPGGFTCEVNATSDVMALLARRGGVEDRLEEAISATGTTIKLDSDADAYADGSNVYVERETITLGTGDGFGNYTGCTRGAEGSNARPHVAGAITSDRARYWMGRRAKLYQCDLDTSTATAVRTAILVDSPRYVNGTITLSFVDVTTEMNRPVGTGWETVGVTSIALSYGDGTDATYTAVVNDSRRFVAGGHVRLDWDSGGAIWGVNAVGSDTITMKIKDLVAFWSDGGEQIFEQISLESIGDMTARSVLFVEGDPADVALMLLHSGAGDQLNSTDYDVLPGVAVDVATSTADLTPSRWGADLPEAWVNQSSFEEMRGTAPIRLCLDEQVSILDLLTGEIAWRLGGYIHIDADGKIAFRKYANSAAPADFTLTKGDVLRAPVDVVDDENEVIATAEVECNWDVRDRKYRHKIGATWVPTFQLYGENGPSIEVRARSLQVGEPAGPLRNLVSPPMSEVDVVARIDAIYSRSRNGVRKVTLQLPWAQRASAIVGAVFEYTDDRVPDGEGGTGVSGRKYEITAVEHDYRTLRITVTAEEMAPGYVIAPSCIVDSYGSNTITIDTTGDDADFWDTSPAGDFSSTWYGRIYDASGNFSSSQRVIFSAVIPGSNQLIVSFPDGLSFTPAAPDLVVFEYGVPSSPSQTSSAGYQYQSHAVIGDDSTYPPTVSDSGGGGSINGHVWS